MTPKNLIDILEKTLDARTVFCEKLQEQLGVQDKLIDMMSASIESLTQIKNSHQKQLELKDKALSLLKGTIEQLQNMNVKLQEAHVVLREHLNNKQTPAEKFLSSQNKDPKKLQ